MYFSQDKDAHGGEVSRGVTNEKGGRGNGHSCGRRKLYTHMCGEAGLDICINEHGDEVRVGSVDVLDKDQVDASKHMVGNVDDGRVDEKTEEEGLM